MYKRQDVRSAVRRAFTKRGKSSLDRSEFIFALHLDLGVCSSEEEAKKLLEDAERMGLVTIEGDRIILAQSATEKVMERIKRKIGDDAEERVRRMMSEKMISRGVAALIIARELGIEYEDLVDGVWRELKNE